MNTRLQSAPTQVSHSQRQSIEDALASEVRVPMAALRAALENLSRQDAHEAGRAQVLAAAADEVGRLTHKVCTLIDAALASPAASHSCRIDELRKRLVRALDPRISDSVKIACENGWAAVAIDAAPFVAALAGFVETLYRSGAAVLVRLSYVNGLDVRLFASVDGREVRFDHRSADGLRLDFAERELEALGVRLHWRTTTNGAVRVALRFDDHDTFGGAA